MKVLNQVEQAFWPLVVGFFADNDAVAGMDGVYRSDGGSMRASLAPHASLVTYTVIVPLAR